MSLVQRGWLTSKRNTNSLWQNAPGEMDKRVRSVCVEIHSGIRVYIAHIRDFQNMWGSNMSKRDWVDSRLYRAANVADHPHVNYCYRHLEMLVQTFDPVFQPLPVCAVSHEPWYSLLRVRYVSIPWLKMTTTQRAMQSSRLHLLWIWSAAAGLAGRATDRPTISLSATHSVQSYYEESALLDVNAINCGACRYFRKPKNGSGDMPCSVVASIFILAGVCMFFVPLSQQNAETCGVAAGVITGTLHSQTQPFYSVSKKTGPLRLIWHNFTNSQHLLIIFGKDRPYLIPNWLR